MTLNFELIVQNIAKQIVENFLRPTRGQLKPLWEINKVFVPAEKLATINQNDRGDAKVSHARFSLVRQRVFAEVPNLLKTFVLRYCFIWGQYPRVLLG